MKHSDKAVEDMAAFLHFIEWDDHQRSDWRKINLISRKNYRRRATAVLDKLVPPGYGNICSNEALVAVTSGIYMTLLGTEGFQEIGKLLLSKSHILAKKLDKLEGVKAPYFSGSFFKEFVVEVNKPVKEIIAAGVDQGVFPGIDVSADGKNLLLVTVSEFTNKDDMDRLANLLGGA